VNLELTTSHPRPGTAVVHAAGEVDVATSPDLRSLLETIAGDPGVDHVVVDLDRVEFIDSSGLGVLIIGGRLLGERGGELCIVCSRPGILRLFEITELRQVLAVHPSLGDALGDRTTR